MINEARRIKFVIRLLTFGLNNSKIKSVRRYYFSPRARVEKQRNRESERYSKFTPHNICLEANESFLYLEREIYIYTVSECARAREMYIKEGELNLRDITYNTYTRLESHISPS